MGAIFLRPGRGSANRPPACRPPATGLPDHPRASLAETTFQKHKKIVPRLTGGKLKFETEETLVARLEKHSISSSASGVCEIYAHPIDSGGPDVSPHPHFNVGGAVMG